MNVKIDGVNYLRKEKMGRLKDKLRKGEVHQEVPERNFQPEPTMPPEPRRVSDIPQFIPEPEPNFSEEQYPEEQYPEEQEQYQYPDEGGFYPPPVPPVPSRQYSALPQYPIPPAPIVRDVQSNDGNPLSILDEIKARPSPKGTLPVMIGGRPIDLSVLEDYALRISPYSLKTILRYHNARTIEEIKGYGRGTAVKMNMKGILLILLAVGMGVVGLFVMMYMPEIMAYFQGGV